MGGCLMVETVEIGEHVDGLSSWAFEGDMPCKQAESTRYDDTTSLDDSCGFDSSSLDSFSDTEDEQDEQVIHKWIAAISADVLEQRRFDQRRLEEDIREAKKLKHASETIVKKQLGEISESIENALTEAKITPDVKASDTIGNVKANIQGKEGHTEALDCKRANLEKPRFGILNYQLLGQHPPFESSSPMQTYQKVTKGIENFDGAAVGMGGLTMDTPYKPKITNQKDISIFAAGICWDDLRLLCLSYKDDGNGDGWDDGFATSI